MRRLGLIMAARRMISIGCTIVALMWNSANTYGTVLDQLRLGERYEVAGHVLVDGKIGDAPRSMTSVRIRFELSAGKHEDKQQDLNLNAGPVGISGTRNGNELADDEKRALVDVFEQLSFVINLSDNDESVLAARQEALYTQPHEYALLIALCLAPPIEGEAGVEPEGVSVLRRRAWPKSASNLPKPAVVYWSEEIGGARDSGGDVPGFKVTFHGTNNEGSIEAVYLVDDDGQLRRGRIRVWQVREGGAGTVGAMKQFSVRLID